MALTDSMKELLAAASEAKQQASSAVSSTESYGSPKNKPYNSAVYQALKYNNSDYLDAIKTQFDIKKHEYAVKKYADIQRADGSAYYSANRPEVRTQFVYSGTDPKVQNYVKLLNNSKSINSAALRWNTDRWYRDINALREQAAQELEDAKAAKSELINKYIDAYQLPADYSEQYAKLDSAITAAQKKLSDYDSMYGTVAYVQGTPEKRAADRDALAWYDKVEQSGKSWQEIYDEAQASEEQAARRVTAAKDSRTQLDNSAYNQTQYEEAMRLYGDPNNIPEYRRGDIHEQQNAATEAVRESQGNLARSRIDMRYANNYANMMKFNELLEAPTTDDYVAAGSSVVQMRPSDYDKESYSDKLVGTVNNWGEETIASLSRQLSELTAPLDTRGMTDDEAQLAEQDRQEKAKEIREKIERIYTRLDTYNAKYNEEAQVEEESLPYFDEPYFDVSEVPTDRWSDEQLRRYQALAGNPEYGIEKAKEYARAINDTLNTEAKIAKLTPMVEAAYNADTIWKKAGTAAAAIGAEVLAMPSKGWEWITKVVQDEAPAESYGITMGDRADALMGAVAQRMNDNNGTIDESVPVFGGKGWGDLVQLGGSVGSSLFYGNVLGSVGTLALFFGSAADEAYDNAIARGASVDQAKLYSALCGSAEVIGEVASLDHLLHGMSGKMLKDVLIQAGIEGTEEVVTTGLNTISDSLVMDGKSLVNRRAGELISAGVGYDEAYRRAWTEAAEDVAWDFVGGTISGGVSATLQTGAAKTKEAVGNAVVKAVTKQAEKAAAKAIEESKAAESKRSSLLSEQAKAEVVLNDEQLKADAESEDESVSAPAKAKLESAQETIDRIRGNIRELEEEHPEIVKRTKAGSVPAAQKTASIDGNAATISGFNFDSNGNLLANATMPDGSVKGVKVDELSLDEGTRYLVQEAKLHPAYGAAMLEMYKGDQDVVQYASDFEQVADIFGAATKLTFEAAWENSRRNRGAAQNLSMEQFRKAMELGRAAVVSEQKTADSGQKTVKRAGKVTAEAVIDGNMRYKAGDFKKLPEATRFLLNKTAELFKVDIRVYQSEADRSGTYQGKNGFIKNGIIYIDQNAHANNTSEQAAVVLTLAHELTHELRRYNASGYMELRDFIMQTMYEKGTNIESLAKAQIAAAGNTEMSMDDAIEEVVANASERMLENTSIAEMVSAEKPALAQRIRNFIDLFKKRLKGAVSEGTRYYREAQAMEDKLEAMQKIWDRAQLAEIQKANSERIKQIRMKGTIRRQEAVAKEQAEKYAKIAEVKKHYTELMEKAQKRRKESAAVKKYRERVLDKVKILSDWMLKNSDKEHIPESMKQVVYDLIASIDTTSESGTTKRDANILITMEKLKDVIQNQKDYFSNDNAESPDIYLDISGEVKQIVANLTKSIRDEVSKGNSYTIRDMTGDELKDLSKVLNNVYHAVRNANRALAGNKKQTISFMGNRFMGYADKLGTAKERSRIGDKAASIAFWENTTPIYAFRRLGEIGKMLFGNLRKGWSQVSFNCIEILNFTNNLYTAKEARAWQQEVREVTLENGDSFRITTAQLMSLYALYKREQARKHLNGGGLRVGNIEVPGSKLVNQTGHYKLSTADMAKLLGDEYLNDRQREVADALQNFMSSTCAEWGNKISMARYGYRAFTEQNYFPIVTDDNLHPAVDPEAKSNDMFRLLNLSATKVLNPNANNALVVGDIFRVFTDHSTDMAKYNALALPLLDIIKWLNYKETRKDKDGHVFTDTVKASMERAYGKHAQRYLVQFIKDLNGVQEGGVNTGDILVKRILSRYKASAVGLNIRVALQQPTSYVRAAMVMSPKYLIKGLKPTKGTIEEMNKYSGIAAWKNKLGLVSTDIGRGVRSQIMHNETALDIVQNKQMLGVEKMDEVTWGALWNASKAQAKAETQLTGEELLQKTAEIFDELIYRTQVVDATMTRSHNMRNPGVLNSISTAFMAEPTLSYNIVLDALSEWASAKRQGLNLKEYSGTVAKSILVYCISATATVLVASLWDAFRDDDDYESFMQKFKSALWGDEQNKWYDSNLIQELLIYNKIPVIKDVWAIFSEGDSPDRMDMQVFVNMKKAWDINRASLLSLLGKGESPIGETGLTVYGAAMANLRALSQMSGFALYNLTRDVTAIYNTVIAPITGEKIVSYEKTDRAEIKNAYLSGFMDEEHAIEELVKTGSADDEDQAFWIVNGWNGEGDKSGTMDKLYTAIETGDAYTYENTVKQLTEHGVSLTNIQGDVRGKIKEWYQGTSTEKASIDKAKAIGLVTKYGGMMNSKAEKLVNNWTCLKVENIEYGRIKDEYLNGNITLEKARQLLNTYGYAKPKDSAQAQANKEATESKLSQWRFEYDIGIDAGGDSFTGIRDAYNSGEISYEQVIEYRMKYAGDDKDKAETYAYRYKWIGGDTTLNPVTANQARNYDAYLTNSGISKRQYYEIISTHPAKVFSGTLKPGSKTSYIPNSKRDKIWAYIDSLKLTASQKDSLATVYAYLVEPDVKRSSDYFKFEQAPWRN